jgi:hypothetical protein
MEEGGDGKKKGIGGHADDHQRKTKPTPLIIHPQALDLTANRLRDIDPRILDLPGMCACVCVCVCV